MPPSGTRRDLKLVVPPPGEIAPDVRFRLPQSATAPAEPLAVQPCTAAPVPWWPGFILALVAMAASVAMMWRGGFVAWVGCLTTVLVLFYWLRYSVGGDTPEPRGFMNAVVRMFEALCDALQSRWAQPKK